MRSIRYSRSRGSRRSEINMTPLIDMVFILLIFFIVTTSFVRESGVDVERPSAESVETKEKANVLLGLTSDGQIFVEGRPLDIRSVRAYMERFLAEVPNGSVVIVADKESSTGNAVQVLDQCRMAGVKNISIAARKQ
ncbi:MAG: biopolymer transporter ExbD [Pseudodesulfovibrio sp.]|uniref:Biopolymer transport protein ExbD/TolR n=1 Tax=Pseudodesulfovibrio aespoeensis (strain ATCC 700646 / DSM 10631 / Aspo-2) TaxID=643562 RepID=E6VYD7_PSEA9|nr:MULTISPECIES: biopolymer transporter ExbD [Pseudodesulfovibrio]MBU4379541.1 biopolymer transporter ExbD [Pseudomonadota bacterium]ADU61595.1 Biopolymer transport protein ExbD/TolR [Pseudodesulfovibrio aespoeensis Aspo-2]MBU4474463.1 biopolymer transporter ExbD [Pseudomonadota bacterium]MBU4516086.1 biopolymer transporter ExbD [Pseudomonadota bacterium]MBU4521956.1 biopolymer transporter ExbD [Pseudomonadota bacterium]